MSNENKSVYRTIVVPLDGSEAAESVLELAKNLAVRSGSTLTLLHVWGRTQDDHERLHRSYIERAAEMVERDIAQICETTACYFANRSATVVPVLLRGEPAEEIVKYAETNKASVILMTTHGRSGLTNPVMSDVTNRVVRNSLLPVWMIRTLGPGEIVCAEWPPKRILVPLDGSERAEKVLPYAIEYSQLFDAEMVLLRVCDEPLITADFPEAAMQTSWEDHVKGMRSHFQGQCSIYLDTVKDRLEKNGIRVTIESMLGNAAEEIVKYTSENRCDLVVVTTHGRSAIARLVSDTPVGRWVFSSVTEQILAATTRGILVVRG